MTDKTFDENMLMLKVNFGFSLTATEEDRAYVRMLKTALAEYSNDDVSRAFSEVMKRCKFKPRVADFIDILEPPRTNAGKAAWAEVLGALQVYGGMDNRYWRTDAATEEAVKAMGGWLHLARLSHFELNKDSLGKAFEAVYERARAKCLDQQPGRIIGARIKDWRTGEYWPLTEVAPRPLLSCQETAALPEHTDDFARPSSEAMRAANELTNGAAAALVAAKRLN